MWSNFKFVINNNEPERHTLINSIKKEKGKIQKTITKHVNYYIQSWNTDDEDKLGKCTDFNVKIVSSHYILQCIAPQKIIPFTEYSIDEYNNSNTNIWKKLINSNLFSDPCKHSLEHESIPQTVQEFNAYNWKPATNNHTIYIVPIISDRMLKIKQPSRKKRKLNSNKASNNMVIDNKLLQLISEFVSSYFQLNVEILNRISMNINDKKHSANIIMNNKIFEITVDNSENHMKFEVCDIIDAILELYENVNQNKCRNKSQKLKDNGYCIIGITNEDIFEKDSGWGILRGRAFGGSSVAVFTSYEYNNDNNSLKNDKLLMLLNTMAHELLHCFGQDHCVFYSCVMNAWSDVIDEYKNNNNDNNKNNIVSVSPMHLCPIDLKKLNIINPTFNILKRYEMLFPFYEKYGMVQQIKWLREIMATIKD
eukprot:199941_1